MKTYNYLLSLPYAAKRIYAVAALLLLLTSVAEAQPGTPSFFNNFANSTSTNFFPLGSSTNRVQWIYGPNVFASGGTGVGTPAFNGMISKIYIKMGGTVSAVSSYSNFTISLSQNVGTANTITSTAWATGLTTCLLEPTKQLTGVLANQWYGFTLTTPFLYDPSQSLMFELKVSSTSGSNTMGQNLAGGNTRRWGTFSGANATSFGTGLVGLGFDLVSATPCAGTPAPGNTVVGTNPVCPGTSFTLTPQNIATLGSGNTFQWQTSPDNIAWSNAPGASTFLSYTTTQTVATWYRVIVTCTSSGLSGTSTPVQVNVSPIQNCYCTPLGATSTFDEEISNVTLGSMNNSSNCTTLGPGPGSILRRYSNYMGFVTPPTIMQGSSVPFSVTQTTCNGNFSNRTHIWIDWNQNGSWLDAGEKVYMGPLISGNHTDVGSITVPITATPGITGMRVINVESSSTTLSPCGAFTWGETEDYLVQVVAATPCAGTPNAGSVTVPSGTLCPNANVTLTASGLTFGSGITYQWESSTTGCAGTFSPVAGETGISYTFLPSYTTTSYRLKTTCANSGLSNFSNCVDVTATIAVSCYCTSNATSTADEEITNVTVGSMNNSSVCGVVAPGPGSLVNRYSNWTTTVPAPSIVQGASTPFSVTQTSCGGAFTNRTAIFIDYNRDGDLTDAGENVFFGPSFIGNHTDAGSFLVPATASIGTTLMRVKNVETSGTFTPCGTFTWGEVEDYFVNIIAPPPFPPACAVLNSPADLVNDICPATGVTLSWSSGAVGGTSGAPGSYDVYFGTSPVPPLVTNTTATSYITGPLVGGQTYFWAVVPKNSFGDASGCPAPRSFSAASTVAFATGCYCTPVYTFQPCGCCDGTGDVITNFSLNSVAFTSGCTNPGAYSFTSAPQIPLTQGGTYPVSITMGPVFGEGAKVWIDFNDNGSFEDAGELLFTGGPALLVTGNIFIPCSANPGIHRLRVRVNFASTAFTSCSQQTFGEAEDYIVNIAPNLVVATVGTATITPALGCGFLGVPFSTTVDNFTGLLQWQFEQPFGANNWIDIAGVNTQTANLVANMPQSSGTITFGLRVKAFDCFNNQVFSNSVQFTMDDPAVATAVTGGERCGPGNVNLSANAAAGHSIEWWSAAAGGSLAGAGSPFIFNAPATTTLFAANRNPVTGCLSSNRIAATATVHDIPVTVASNDGPLCAAAGESATALATLTATGGGTFVNAELQSPLSPNNGSSAVGLEITNTSSVPIIIHFLSFASSASIGTSQTESVYYKTSAVNCIAQGNITTNPTWTLIGSATAVSAGPYPALTQIPLDLNITIPPGMTYGFALGGNGVRYNGTSTTCLSAPIVSDANIAIRAAFGGTLTSTILHRNFVGKVSYSAGSAVSFAWTPGLSCSNAECSQGTVNLFPSATPYQFTVTITDVFGCSSTSTTDVTVNKIPNMAALQSATLNGGVAALFPAPPTFLDIPEFTETLTCDKVVNYDIIDLGIPTPTYTHSMTGATVVPGGTSGTGSGTAFTRLIPTGRTTITVNSSNVCGSQNRTFRVTLTDNVAPVISTLPVPVTNTNGGECASLVQVTQPDLINGGLFDNCPNASLIFIDRSDGRTQFEPYQAGITTVTWMATDASGNTSTATQNVEVINIKPVITSLTSSAGNVIFAGQTSTLTTTFTDEDGGGTHTVMFYKDKNDPVPASTKVLGPDCIQSCNGVRSYSVSSDPILFDISTVSEPKVEVVDGCNTPADQVPNISTIQYFVVAVIGNEFITIGGHFLVPAGATNSEGLQANIGGVVKQGSGQWAGTFRGQFNMVIHDPAINQDFHVHTANNNQEVNFQYLAISCSLGVFRGPVKINGVDGFEVFGQVTDEDMNPSTSNLVRIKVSTLGGGTVIWDMQPGLTEALTSGNGGGAAIITQLSNGKIKVHPDPNQSQSCVVRMQSMGLGDELLQNVPNPFSGQTEIHFIVPEDGKYTLKVYNYLGQEITTLFNGEAAAGFEYAVRFDGSNYEAGIYTYTLTGAGVSETRRMNLIW